jgi:hypothetical protein
MLKVWRTATVDVVTEGAASTTEEAEDSESTSERWCSKRGLELASMVPGRWAAERNKMASAGERRLRKTGWAAKKDQAPLVDTM